MFRLLPWSIRRRLIWRIATLFFLTSQATTCIAHEKWLWPNRFSVEKAPAWISFDATWSDQPFAAEMGVGDKPITVVDPDGRSGSPERAFIGKTKSTCETELTREGTYRLESVDPLTYWTQVEEAGGPKWLKQPKGEVKNKKIMRSDLYWSKAMAYVTVGKSTPPVPLDADSLSIVPATHPNEIFAGSTLELKVLSYGKPLPNAKIKVYDNNSTGHAPIQTIMCDDQGKGTIELKSAGLYLFSSQLEREVKDDPKADIHSFNVYLTLQVRPAKK
jgi:uncharacterized GH25 family protein